MRSAADGLGWVVQPGPLSIDSFGEFVRQVAGATAVSRVCIVADRHRAALPTISGLVGELVERFDAEVHAAEDDSDELVASIAGAGPWDVVIGVGGGVTLDVAKLVALRSDDLRRATAPGRSSRVVLPDSARTARLALVPTTFGTGSEQSLSACLTTRGRKRLVSGTALGADVVLARPDLLASLDNEQVTEGLVEVALRLTTVYASGETAPLADTLTQAALRQVVELAPRLGCGERATSDLRTLASISAFSHSGWLSRDRPPMTTLPWIITTEASLAWSCTKAVAASLVMPAYWSVMPERDGRLGSHERLCELWAASLPSAATPAEALSTVTGERLAQPSGEKFTLFSDDALAARITERWGAGLPFTGEASRDDVREVVAAALALGKTVAQTL
ncbi:daptide-type RiPP biosynthesis dehydogenase [Curtobacterium sp. NPDC088465]|uniref:daptide-type RiPP biosynthesis dehydogenase n=1 Tax=Curtobacterium sp. NPDC088465 TaxID=3363967 RepID=UPI00380D2F88